MGLVDIIGGVFKPVADYFNRKQELTAAEHQAKLQVMAAQAERTADLVKQGQADDAAWEMQSMKLHAEGWKDEFVLAMLAAPFLAGFFKGAHPAIQAGWQALSYAPGWYTFLFPSICGAIYGIRLWRRNQSDT